jgi:hypothetical protein
MPTFVHRPEDLARALAADGEASFGAVVGAIRTTCALRAPGIFQRLVDGEHPKPVDRGTYRRSLKVEKIERGATVYNSAPHAPIVEGGRRPGSRMPPLDLIAEWVRRKGVGVQVGPVRRGRSRPEVDVRGLAFVVARAIARRGLPAHRIFARLERQLTPVVQHAIADAAGGAGRKP